MCRCSLVCLVVPVCDCCHCVSESACVSERMIDFVNHTNDLHSCYRCHCLMARNLRHSRCPTDSVESIKAYEILFVKCKILVIEVLHELNRIQQMTRNSMRYILG